MVTMRTSRINFNFTAHIIDFYKIFKNAFSCR